MGNIPFPDQNARSLKVTTVPNKTKRNSTGKSTLVLESPEKQGHKAMPVPGIERWGTHSKDIFGSHGPLPLLLRQGDH